MATYYEYACDRLSEVYSKVDKAFDKYKERINGFEDWKRELIEMYEYLVGSEPRIEGDYWMIDDHRGYDLWLMYEQGINAPQVISEAK